MVQKIEQVSEFPKSIDINITAKCNLACTFCWGPDHNINDGMELDDWVQILKFFYNNGTRGVVVTGGEPLTRKDTPDIIQFAKNLGFHITLSTNTLLLDRLQTSVLPYIDEIGIPIDGYNKDSSKAMRIGRYSAFDSAIDSLGWIKRVYPKVHVTVRTVISRVNINQICNIAKLLQSYAGNFDAWKLYQFAPFSIGARNEKSHTVSERQTINLMKKLHNLPLDFSYRIMGNNEHQGRYVFVGPTGDIYGIREELQFVVAGNWHTTDRNILHSGICTIFDPESNQNHAVIK